MDRTPTHITHLCSTVCSQAWNARHALGSSHTDGSVIFVRLKRVCHLVCYMSHPWLLHLPFTTSTSSSSFTLPFTTTQEHAAQPEQHDQLREHPVHHAHLQALPVDKLRHQESPWREKPAEWRKPAHDNFHRFQHRYAIVVQDLATQWLQGYPCKTKTTQETVNNLRKFFEPEEDPKVVFSDNSLEFVKVFEDSFWNHCTSRAHRSEDQRYRRKSSEQSQTRHVFCSHTVRIG